ncbi:hypothetical protein ES702_03919 [subsurface metagenome]
MVKKAITIRLDDEILKEIDDRGKRSDVIRNMIELALNPIPMKIKTVIKEVIREVPVKVMVEVPKLVVIDRRVQWLDKKELFREIIISEIKDGMPKWYCDSRKIGWEREYGEKLQ